MAVTLYSSTDTGAPTLTNQPGNIVAILDACLVNGYGSQVAAGWTTAYTGTSQRTYQAASGNKMYLNIDDSQATNWYSRGFATMTAWNTGTGAFPTTTQASGNGTAYSRGNSTTVDREWWVIATPTFFYFIWDYTELTWSTGSVLYGFYFGDFPSYKASDPYSSLIAGGSLQQYIFATSNPGTSTSYSSYFSGYIARKYDGISISSPFILSPVCGYLLAGAGGGQQIGNPGSYFAYPETVTSSLLVSPFYIMEWTGSNPALRGWMPGLYGPASKQPLNQGDTFTGVSGSNLAGKTFQVFNYINGSVGQIFLETSDTWLSTMWQ